jgi:hypothetical protein
MALGHHDDGGGHGQDHGHAQDASHEHDHAAAQGDDGGSNAHCGPCTACCASTSIAGPVGVALAPASSNTKYFFSQLSPRGVEPHGLDRPPLAS